MKTKIKLLSIVFSLVLIQGCSSVIPIKTQMSNVIEVTNCITDSNSHGQCGQNRSLYNASILGSDSSYFEALSLLDLPKVISNDKILKFEGESLDLKTTFAHYNNKFNDLNCESYNRDAAKLAQIALLSDSNRDIHELYGKQLSGGSSAGSETPTIEFDSNKFSMFLEMLYEADNLGGVHSLQCAAIQQMSTIKNKSEMDAMGSLLVELSYTKEYFKAYFRQGKFIQGKTKVSWLYEMLKDKLKSDAPFLSDNQITDITNGLFKKLTGKEYKDACPSGNSCDIAFAGKLESTQFVTRSGVEYGFPHITVSVDPLAEKKISVSKIDWNKIGAEVARVYMEAVGDKLIGLPADPRSTACKINSLLCYSEQSGYISSDDFALVSEHSDRVDTLVSNAVGKAVRGAGWISLNNEAIASIIETAIGTSAKKVAEKVAYCTYSCTSEHKAGITSGMLLGEVRVKVTR
ncbi:hypothetical protein Meth11DRAFT_2124 [Methylophilaceae bacterium 11]|nr:hypothetical protein Meth11DRAFT_2124 [Methylophilaceae bacterium 11]